MPKLGYLNPRTIKTMEKVLQHIIEHGPITNAAIAIDLGIERRLCEKFIKRLRLRQMVHISGHCRNFITAGQRSPLYSAGPGIDKSPPLLNTKKERLEAVRRYQSRNRMRGILISRANRGTLCMWSQLEIR